MELDPDKPKIDAKARIKNIDRWNRTARALWGIGSVLTLPLTSAVCSFVAFGYIQTQISRNGCLTLSQTMTLAD